MAIRNRANEQPGTRYGRRVVLRSGFILCGQTKYVALWVRCDCGRVDLVRKSELVAGRAGKCRDCETAERAEIMVGLKFGEQWRCRRNNSDHQSGHQHR